MSVERPPAVRQILTCLQREHCHGNGGCRYLGRCNGGPAESLGMTAALVAYIGRLEDAQCSCVTGTGPEPSGVGSAFAAARNQPQ